MDNKITKTDEKPVTQQQNKTPNTVNKKPNAKTSDDFKRKYFEYYDDIKISDRQDW